MQKPRSPEKLTKARYVRFTEADEARIAAAAAAKGITFAEEIRERALAHDDLTGHVRWSRKYLGRELREWRIHEARLVRDRHAISGLFEVLRLSTLTDEAHDRLRRCREQHIADQAVLDALYEDERFADTTVSESKEIH
ncbi:MAG TPA: hypothetical protein VGQ44_17720 [Gemmatimonadaceae bacterium]|jgi:hypothetical protein|nr:hypothetical protein [Gemmatimonadaceae bacterium]